MLVSSVAKNQFVSLFIGAVLLLFPMIDFAFANSSIVNMLYNFLPTRMIMGIKIWQGYGLFYVAGHTFPYQYAAVAFAVVVSIALCPLTKYFFTRHQIGN
jgi:ABC-type transport system involved in multi-copper enzyme maturation permease subunit